MLSASLNNNICVLRFQPPVGDVIPPVHPARHSEPQGNGVHPGPAGAGQHREDHVQEETPRPDHA